MMQHVCLAVLLFTSPPIDSVVSDSGLTSILRSWEKRDASVQPGRVVAELHLAAGDTVADLGAGNGYFSWRLGEAVGPSGRVLALDINEESLEINRRVANRHHVGNVETRVVARDDPGLEPGEAGLVFVSYTWQFLDDRIRYADLLNASLNTDGRLAVLGLDIPGLPVGTRNPSQMRPYRWTNRLQVWREAEAGGFRLTADHRFLPGQYFMIFEMGPSPIYQQISGFIYVNSFVALGLEEPRLSGRRTLLDRGFRLIIDLRNGNAGSSTSDSLETIAMVPDNPSTRERLSGFLNTYEVGAIYVLGDTHRALAKILLDIDSTSTIADRFALSAFERDRLLSFTR